MFTFGQEWLFNFAGIRIATAHGFSLKLFGIGVARKVLHGILLKER